MLVFGGYKSLGVVHADVGMVAWNAGQMPSPLPAGAGFIVRGVHLVDTYKGLTLCWRDANGQRIYLAVRNDGKDGQGQRRFRMLGDDEYPLPNANPVTLAIYGVDEELAIKRQARWGELLCRPEEVPYVIAELQVGDD